MKHSLDNFIGFEWDAANIDKNLTKHNVASWECEQVFFNDPLLGLPDVKHSTSENRWVAFGKTDPGRLLTIVFTERKKLLRVVSARDMSRRERKYYEKNT